MIRAAATVLAVVLDGTIVAAVLLAVRRHRSKESSDVRVRD